MLTTTASPLFVSVAPWPYGFTQQARLVDRFGAVVWRCTHRHHLIRTARACAEAERMAWIVAGKAMA